MAPALDDRDWSQLTPGQRIQQLEVEGYLVLPDLLDSAQMKQLKRETAQLTTTAVDYSVHQRVRPHLEFHGGEITRLIAHPPAIKFLEDVFGQSMVFMTYAYARSEHSVNMQCTSAHAVRMQGTCSVSAVQMR